MVSIHRTIVKTTVFLACLACVAACGSRPAANAPAGGETASARLARAAENLQQPLVIEGRSVDRSDIEDRMRQFSVPGVSVAVIDDGRLAAARAWGVTVAGEDQPVTTETLFQAGSVSKPVASLLALALVGDGELQLDRQINEDLQSWKVPDNEFTREAPVTLRHVLTHQAGFTSFAYSIPRSDGAMPTMAELLRGGVRDWPVVTVESLPGSRHAYSNVGYCVLQLVLEDRSSLSLDELATERMFDQLGMTHSTFAEPLEPSALATAASGHTRQRGGLGSKREAVPVKDKAEIAPGATGGLWSTPSDLALLSVEVLHAWRGESGRLLTTELAHEFLTPQVDNEGLGIFVEGEGPELRARHNGSMRGFIANLVFYPNAGKGAVVMANSDGGRWLDPELIAAIADEFQWPGYPVRRRLGTATPDQLRQLVGVYTLDASPDYTFTVTLQDGSAVGQIQKYPPFELTPTTEPDLFVLPRESLEILFRRGEDGAVSGVTLRRAGDSGNNYSRRGDP